MFEHGFTLERAITSGASGVARYRNGDRWIELNVSYAPQDAPDGYVEIFFGIGAAGWDNRKAAVPLRAYLYERPAGKCLTSLSPKDSVRTTVEKMSRLLRSCADDFLIGDTSAYTRALVKHRY
jgi:hypothetical protein